MSLATRLSDLATAIATDIKQLRVWITGSSSGNLNGLTTTDKTSIVNALNEVNAKPSGTGGWNAVDASEATKGIVYLASLAEVATGTDVAKAVTAAGVRQERIALKNEILGAGIPAALDTLKELADALGDDANFAATMTTALGNRLRVDINNQGLTAAQQLNGRTNLDVYGTTDIGDPNADLVAVYTAAKA
jgi:hypothetical protein